jgi:general secretion pathway protein M
MHPILRRALALTILGAVLLAAWAAVVSPLADRFARYESTIAQSQATAERYRRILAMRDPLARRVAELRDNRVLREGFIAAAGPGLGAVVLQNKIKEAVSAAGAQLTSIQVLTEEKEAGFTRVGVRARITGDISALRDVLHGLETAWPSIFIDRVNIRARTRRSRDNRRELTAQADLSIQFDAYGYMEAPAAAPATTETGR